MAITLKISSVIVLSLVLGASFSLPISSGDLEIVQLTKSLSKSDVTEKESAPYTKMVLSHDEEIKLVPSFSTETVLKAFTVSFETDHVKRIKRAIGTGGPQRCPSDTIELYGECWPREQYLKMTSDDYVEAS